MTPGTSCREHDQTIQPSPAQIVCEGSMRTVYVTLAGLSVVSVVIQFYFAAFGVFTAPENDSQYILHLTNGRFLLPVLFLLTIIAAAVARAPGRLIGFTAIPFGLLILQTLLFVIAGLAGASPEKTNLAGQLILGLHAINGLCILGVSIMVFVRARRFAREQVGDAPPAGSRSGAPTASSREQSSQSSQEQSPREQSPQEQSLQEQQSANSNQSATG